MKSSNFKRLLTQAIELCRYYGMDVTIELIIKKWSESQRYWHTPKHLYEMLDGVERLHKQRIIKAEDFDLLTVAVVFHDIVYDPQRQDNEEKSVEFMISTVENWSKKADIEKIADIIMDTKKHQSEDRLSILFNQLDTEIIDAPFEDLLDWENKISREYKYLGSEYKNKRIKFLQEYAMKHHPENKENLSKLILYLRLKDAAN